ncbi:hypothetical protein METH_01680 [Leisingera methylohalidivorans DSM 14336]|uniref:Uncharacterized protein n=1 Tax=Leisingera methylohalidivorans DSM 14336 TaxID=999552 RepID=V9VY20_9RHOB|nr:hypothetical protein METH_01680 [Leisingera methylohalidivorans DSM 14336]
MANGNIRKGNQTTATGAEETALPATGASAPPLHISSTLVTGATAGVPAPVHG